MKTKYIAGIIIGVIFIAIAIYSFDSSKIEYADFQTAKQNNKTVQVIGSWMKDKPYSYDNKNNIFTFYLKDEKQGSAEVIFSGSKPNNFDIAPMVVVKGKFEGQRFLASEVLTKCPSKYDSKMESSAKN